MCVCRSFEPSGKVSGYPSSSPLVILPRDQHWARSIHEIGLMRSLVTSDHNVLQKHEGDPAETSFMVGKASSRSYLTAHDLYALFIARTHRRSHELRRRSTLLCCFFFALLPAAWTLCSHAMRVTAGGSLLQTATVLALAVVRGTALLISISLAHTVLAEWHSVAAAAAAFNGLTRARYRQGATYQFLDLRYPENVEVWQAIREQLHLQISARARTVCTCVNFTVLCFLMFCMRMVLDLFQLRIPGGEGRLDTTWITWLLFIVLGVHACLIIRAGVILNDTLDSHMPYIVHTLGEGAGARRASCVQRNRW